MRESKTYEIRCTYCGELLEGFNNGIRCECGSAWGVERISGGYYYDDMNNIDNILEDKRSGRYNNM